MIYRGCFLLAMVLCLIGCGGGVDDGAVLIIESEPSGSEVVIGSRNYGRTPTTIRGLSEGQYYAILAQYGFKRKTQSIALPQTGEIRVTAQMEPLVGYLSITTDPPRGRVFIEGEGFIGETPLKSFALGVGDHSYTIERPDYLTVERDINVQEDRRYSYTHRLTAMQGTLQVFSRPTGATIYINDEPQTVLTPTRFSLVPGDYTVGVHLEGHILEEELVRVEPNSEETIDLRMDVGNVPLGMVLVAEGEFIFGFSGGAPDEDPEKKITLPAFYIDKYEVSNREFAEVFPIHTYDERMENYPAQGITWNQATLYAQTVGKRLPTEVEWEKAARGTDGRDYPWGNKFDPTLANIAKGNDKETKSARRREYNGQSVWGALDMSGNVYEWTSDWYQVYEGNTRGIDADDYGQQYRVLRGGSYLTDQFEARAARRHYDKVENGKEDYGFRCVMDLPGEPAQVAPE